MEDYSESIRQEILNSRFETWKTFLRDLPMSAELDHTVVRFPNSSTYIFSTGSETFWMMDPAFSRADDSAEELKQLAGMIREKIRFMVLTHLHSDHCQFELVQMLADSPIRWVIPAVCAEPFLARSGIPEDRLIVLNEGDSCSILGIRITAGKGFHRERNNPNAVPSASYEMILPDGIRLFFPADVRDFHLKPSDYEPVDYTFGHVFLGRADATGSEFPLLDDFCRFMTQKQTDNLILAHLYEIGRQPKDLWTCRHGNMIRSRLKTMDPHLNVLMPRFGESIHLVKAPSRFQDPFLFWSKSEREEFLSFLGISIKMDHQEWMERAICDKVPVLEWMPAQALKIPSAMRLEQLERWRETGGRCLSIHLPNFPLNGSGETDFAEAVRLALESGANRVTVHVPDVPAGEMEQRLEEVTDKILNLARPLTEAGTVIGIENLHMKPHTRLQDRPCGFIPPECVQLVKRLREKSNSDLWGSHFDIGHSYSNPPYCRQYDTKSWLTACGPFLNGMHLHQFERQWTEEQQFPSGHRNITSRNTGHPSLIPLFEFWKNCGCRVPMFLEVMRGVEPDPFAALARLRREPF